MAGRGIVLPLDLRPLLRDLSPPPAASPSMAVENARAAHNRGLPKTMANAMVRRWVEEGV